MNADRAGSLLQGSVKAGNLLLSERNLKVSLPGSLGIIGNALTADRAYLYRCSYDEWGVGSASQAYIWKSEKAEPQTGIPEFSDIPFENMKEFFYPLLRGEYYIGKVRFFPETARDTLESRHGQSFIALPVQVEGKLWGFTGFDNSSARREWSEDELLVLLSYMTILKAAVERSEIGVQLLGAKDAAEAANRAKTTFITNVSHEIRTPLNAILGFSELISEKKTDPQTQKYIKAIKTAGDSLLSLINTILDLSRMDAFRLTLYPEPISISKILTEFETIFSLRAIENGIVFEVKVSGDLPPAVLLDPSRIRQIFYNLIGNALKFTERGSIWLEARVQALTDDKVELCLSVQDTGIGISKEDSKKIFKAFTQGDPGWKGKYSGTGLGLTISSRLAELMGGRIELESEPGKGSRFTLVLPEVQVVRSVSAQVTAQPLASRFEPAEILLIEDNRANRMVVQGYLEDSGLTLLEAEDGEIGLELALAFLPALILLDIQMPIMDGREALRRLRTMPETRGIPVIALTSNTLDLDDDSIKNQCQGYIEKPFNRAMLFSNLRKFLEPKHDEALVSAKALQTSGEAIAERRLTCGHSCFSEGERLASQFMDGWSRIAELRSIDDVEEFATMVAKEAGRLGDRPAVFWAEDLLKACDSFDMVRMEKLFVDFPSLASVAPEGKT